VNSIEFHPLLAMIGTTEILIILGIVVLLFGARKIPELFKGVGTGIKEFKKASKDDDRPA
jgi:sec-independent protein translocase protein TatA